VTATPVVQAEGKPASALFALPAADPSAAQTSQGQAILSTEEQLAQVVAPVRDLRDLALRLKPEAGNIPLVVNEDAPTYEVGDLQEFWVHDLEANRNFQITAELIHKTDVAYAWAEQGKPVERDEIIRAIDHFSHTSYPAVISFFGSEWNPGVDNDPRLHVLHATGLGDGIAGYYSSTDEYSRLARDFSNEKEIFYINLTWLNSSHNYPYYESVLAHELQHMVHWYRDRNEETWVNEGMSELAQQIAGFESNGSSAGAFAAVPDTQLTTWGDVHGQNGVHYGSAFLFMAYFVQRFGMELTRALVAHPANGADGFSAVLAGAGLELTFDDLFADWVVANYTGDPNALGQDGLYGYRELAQDSPAPAATHDDYPTPAQTGTVANYATDYLLLEQRGDGSEDVQLHFHGATATRLADLQPASGRYTWWSNRGEHFDTRLTRRFDLSALAAGAPVEMTATFWYDIEHDYDFGYVLASTDGKQWDILPGEHTVENTGAGNALGPGFTGKSGGDEAAWVSERFDLSAYAGGEVWIRFEYVTDDAINTSGWFVDDVAIPIIGYATDFEQGADGWESEGWLLTDNHLNQRWLVQLLIFEDDRLTSVERLPVDEQGRVSVAVDGLDEQRSAVLAVSALAPATTEAAEYSYWIDAQD
jgi:hypothetical protein